MSIPDSARHQNRKSRRVPLEAQLAQILGNLKSPRDRQLVARHLGWDGRPPCSLSEAGAAFQITRERARQIYAGALPLLRQDARTRPLDAVLSFVRTLRPQPVCEVERQLQERGFTSGRFSLEGVLTAARLFHRTPGFELEQFGGTWFVGKVSQPGRAILLTAAKHVEHHGAARVSVVAREVSSSPGGPVRNALVRAILQTRADLRWLDQAGEWFWLTSVSRNRLLTRIQKVLAVFPRLPLSVLHQSISRDYKPLRVPEVVLRSFCEALPWCRISGDDVLASEELNVEAVLSGGEAITCAVLREHGGAMPLAELEKRCYQAGVKRANLWRILSFSPLIRRLDRQVYGLISPAARPASCGGRRSRRSAERCMQT